MELPTSRGQFLGHIPFTFDPIFFHSPAPRPGHRPLSPGPHQRLLTASSASSPCPWAQLPRSSGQRGVLNTLGIEASFSAPTESFWWIPRAAAVDSSPGLHSRAPPAIAAPPTCPLPCPGSLASLSPLPATQSPRPLQVWLLPASWIWSRRASSLFPVSLFIFFIG